MSDTKLYQVEADIGGRIRRLTCTLEAAEEIQTAVGRNPFDVQRLLMPDGATWCPPSDVCKIMAALLRKSEPDVDVKRLLQEMEMYLLPRYVEAIARVLSGPESGKEPPPEEANPPQANV